MKKILSIVVALVMMMSVITLVACDSSETFTGEYSYTAYGMTYGAKVDVVMTGGVISNLKLYTDEETEWVGLSDAYPDYGWTDEARQVWLDGVNNLMLSFVGMTADEVAGISAVIGGVNGAADSVDSDFNVTGATQSSARVVLAIQNAICDGPSVAIMTSTGSYSYEAYGTTYGVMLDVTTTEGKITNITLYDDETTGWVSLSAAYPDYGWTDEARQVWLDGVEDLLESFYGMTADEVGAISATIAGVVGDEDAVDADYNVTGATQSSARVILALQNALCGGLAGIPDPTVSEDGTYTGTASSDYASIEVSVVVTDGVIASVTIADGSTTNTGFSHLVTDEALATLTASFVGMTPAEVVAADSTSGFISGATVSSTTVLEAVQDAMTIADDADTDTDTDTDTDLDTDTDTDTEVEGVEYTGSATGTVYSNDFTVNVTVTVDAGKVVAVSIDEGSETNYSWTSKVTESALATLTESFVGMTVEEVLAASTTDGFISGATVTSNTVLLAVQDALSNYVVPLSGSATGTVYSNDFTVNVSVTVEDGKVVAVSIDEDSETNYSWTSKVTESALATLTESFVGMTVEEVLAASTTDGFISGATVTSNTVLSAVQDALSSLAD